MMEASSPADSVWAKPLIRSHRVQQPKGPAGAGFRLTSRSA